jgi:GNAT superfamily N-acetyltransferase
MREYVDAIWGWDDDDQARRRRNHLSAPVENGARWIIASGGTDVGMLEVVTREDETYLAAIEIAPGWQGRGIGASILTWLREQAAERGVAVRLRVLRSNPRACRFYEREGFTRDCERDTHVEYVAGPP